MRQGRYKATWLLSVAALEAPPLSQKAQLFEGWLQIIILWLARIPGAVLSQNADSLVGA